MNTNQIAAETAREIFTRYLELRGMFREEDCLPIIQAAIEKATEACTCIPMNEHDCPVHSIHWLAIVQCLLPPTEIGKDRAAQASERKADLRQRLADALYDMETRHLIDMHGSAQCRNEVIKELIAAIT